MRLCVAFLEQIAKLTSSVMLEICAEQCNLNEQVNFDFRFERKLNILHGFSQTPYLNIITIVTVWHQWIWLEPEAERKMIG